MRVCALLVMLSSVCAASASAQSLADVARKENERRQSAQGAGKTWTNQDLKPVAGAAAEPAVAEPSADADHPAAAKDADAAPHDDKAADASKDEKSGKAADAAEAKDQAYWAKRMGDLRAQLERDETFRDALQARIDALTTDFVNRDDPAQRAQIAADRQKAMSELDRVKKSIEQGKRAIPALEEEARREGVPAGWLR